MTVAPREVEEILRAIDPIESVAFDLSVARHMIETARWDIAEEYLGGTAALLELRRSRDAGFITPEEYEEASKAIEAILADVRKRTISEEGARKLHELIDKFTARTYTIFHEYAKEAGLSISSSLPKATSGKMGIYPLIERPTPLFDLLKRRKTLILKKPLARYIDPPEVVAIDRRVPVEEAIEITARSKWATGLAEGWLRTFFPNLSPGTPEYEEAKARIARIVSERLWKG